MRYRYGIMYIYMSFGKIFDLTAGVYFNFYNIYMYLVQYNKKKNSSCKIEFFVETHLCKLCVMLRSRVLLGVSSLRI